MLSNNYRRPVFEKSRKARYAVTAFAFCYAIFCSGGCRLRAPDDFFSAPVLSAGDFGLNVRDGGELWSGFITGRAPKGGYGNLQYAFDNQGTQDLTPDTDGLWKIPIPSGAQATVGKNRWRIGSKHTLTLTTTTTRASYSISFTRQLNKDANGDGIADIVAGAILNDGQNAAGSQTAGNAQKGAAYVYYGTVSGIRRYEFNATEYDCYGPPDCTVFQNPENMDSLFGISVDFVGDVNGDGYGDVGVASANHLTNVNTYKGAAYIFYGSPNGITRHEINSSSYSCSGPPDCTVIQNPEDVDNFFSSLFPMAVAAAGDLNGDGYGDLVLGVPANFGIGESRKGAAYAFYGSGTGVTLHPINNSSYNCNGPPDCTVVQNPDNVPYSSDNTNFGRSVSIAGDLNGDDYNDIVIGSPRNYGAGSAHPQTAGTSQKGAAYVFYGSSGGISLHPLNTTAYPCYGPPNGCSVLQNPSDSAGWFGDSVASAGDVNGDGYDDLVIGAPRNSGMGTTMDELPGATNKGGAYIFYGSATGVTSHPFSSSAYFCGGPPDDCSVIQNPDNQVNGNFGDAVSAAGDVNGDGFSDVIVGAWQNNGANGTGVQSAGANAKGAAYVFYGSALGVKLHAFNATSYFCGGPPDCTVIQNPNNESGRFALSVRYAGDVNADGFADIVVGAPDNRGLEAAPQQIPGATRKGGAYVFYGGTRGIVAQPLNATGYVCSGPPDCTVLQNPDNKFSGRFGFSISLVPKFGAEWVATGDVKNNERQPLPTVDRWLNSTIFFVRRRESYELQDSAAC